MSIALIGLAVIAGYCLFVLASPAGTCWRCHGQRVIRRTGSNGRPKRPKPCRTCKGRGKARRPGATLVHRLFWLVAGDTIRARMQQRNADLLESRKEAGR